MPGDNLFNEEFIDPEYGGERYTIGEFTAKNMPENSISKSGICKGPKYFSFNGVTLYQLKNSFLKKK